jgi:hypothetical protein
VGDDWRVFAQRTMGSANITNTWVPDPKGHVDVRVNDGPGGWLSIIIDAGPDRGGDRWSFLPSFGHLYGQGPLVGLGADAYANWLLFSVTPPWFGTLSPSGAARVDLTRPAVPPGIQADLIFILQDPATGALTSWTKVLMYDS